MTVDPTHRLRHAARVFPNPTRELLPGMFVRARLEEGTRADGHPRAAARRDPQPEGRGRPRWSSARTTRSSGACPDAERAVGNRGWSPTGLKPGDRVIVDGLQKIDPARRSSRAAATAAAPAPSPPDARRRASSTMSRFFIDRPDLRLGHRHRHHARRARSRSRSLPIAQYPGIAPPDDHRQRDLSRRLGARRSRTRSRRSSSSSMNGIDNLRYIVVVERPRPARRRSRSPSSSGTEPDIAQVQVQNKLQLATPLLPQEVQQQGVQVTKSSAQLPAWSSASSPRTAA